MTSALMTSALKITLLQLFFSLNTSFANYGSCIESFEKSLINFIIEVWGGKPEN